MQIESHLLHLCSLKKLKTGGDLQNNNWRMKGDKLLGKSSNKSFWKNIFQRILEEGKKLNSLIFVKESCL